jgi:hypothetical protein
MLTRFIREHAGRPTSGRHSWLLAALVLGILGMHSLVTGPGTPGAHHAPAAYAVTSAHHAAPGDAHDVMPPRVAPGHATSPHLVPAGEEEGPSTLALCMALLLAFVVAAVGVRRTTWVSLLDRTRSRMLLPLAPVLRDRTPVPRFTVMRC